MAYIYSPSIGPSGAAFPTPNFDLEQPVRVWDARHAQVGTQIVQPSRDGGSMTGLKQAPVQITVKGIVKKASAQLMEEWFDLLETRLLAVASGGQFALFRYYDAAAGDARFYDRCVVGPYSKFRDSKIPTYREYSFTCTCQDGIETVVTGGTPSQTLTLSGLNLLIVGPATPV